MIAVVPAGATALSAFHTPAWTLQCDVVGEEHPPTFNCSMPRDGSFVEMGAHGRVRLGRNPKDKGLHDPYAARRLLGFGQYWKFGRLFGCVNRISGLKCWNQVGHGWLVERGRVTVF
jgi:hypothetical protein